MNDQEFYDLWLEKQRAKGKIVMVDEPQPVHHPTPSNSAAAWVKRFLELPPQTLISFTGNAVFYTDPATGKDIAKDPGRLDSLRDQVRSVLFDRWDIDQIAGDPEADAIEETLDDILAIFGFGLPKPEGV